MCIGIYISYNSPTRSCLMWSHGYSAGGRPLLYIWRFNSIQVEATETSSIRYERTGNKKKEGREKKNDRKKKKLNGRS